jgi:hypothetical protein
MAKIMSLDGAGGLGATKPRDCKCVRNSRTGRTVKLCPVPKGTGKGRSRSGWAFVKGGC